MLRIRLPERIAFSTALYGSLLCVPMMAVLGMGTEHALQAVLAARGYHYCTYHVISTDRGGNGTWVYVRDDQPGSCAAVRAAFPPRTMVPGRRAPFDLPPR